jgi:DnaJ-domain-containing protein 1
MTDDFDLFAEPRRPWLDPAQLKSRFLQLSAETHPDRCHEAGEEQKRAANQRFAELNAAYHRLREPRERLRYLLELELGAKPKDVQRIPPGTMELFTEVGQLCRDIDAFLAEKSRITAPMLKVRLFEKGLEWTDRLNALQQRINHKREELDMETQSLNATWDNAPAVGSPTRLSALPLERLEQLYRILSYIARWTTQLQERAVLLAL